MTHKVVIDLLPLRDDGANGGNAIFILALINYFQKNYPNTIHIICKKKIEKFILSKFEYQSKKINFYHSYIQIAPFFSVKVSSNKLKMLYLVTKFSTFGQRVCSFVDKKLINKTSSILIKIIRKINFLINKPFSRMGRMSVSLIQNLQNNSDLILFNPFSHFDGSFELFARVVSIIYDVQHKDLPQFHSSKEIINRDYFYSNSLNTSDKVITISDFSKERIEKNYPIINKNIDDSKIVVEHLPCLSSYSKESNNLDNIKFFRRVDLSKNFFYTPANYWEHKNHKSLLIAILMFVKNNKSTNFIFSGKFIDNNSKDEFKKFIRFNNLQKRVFLFDYITNEEVGLLYCRCLAVIAPSLYEGFGMTLKEAYFSKKVVIASDIPAHREIADSKTTIFFNPRNPMDILRKLTNFFEIDVKSLKFDKKNKPDLVYKRYSEIILGIKN